jgi:hypothetical protein
LEKFHLFRQSHGWVGGLWNKAKKKERKTMMTMVIGNNNNNDDDRGNVKLSSLWQMTQFWNARCSLELPFLEQYFVMMDGKFASWYFSTVLTESFLGQPRCIDFILYLKHIALYLNIFYFILHHHFLHQCHDQLS